MASGAADPSADPEGSRARRTRPAWLAPMLLALMVLLSALVATMPLGAAGLVPSPAEPEANQKQNQSDTSAALPEERAPQAPTIVVEPVVPAPPHVAEVPDNCVVLCGFVL